MLATAAGHCVFYLSPVLRSRISEYSASADLFQCQHSTHQDGQVFIPNIPDLYFDHTNAASFISQNNLFIQAGNSFTYFFTIPPESTERNCSGTVVAMQYCYQIRQTLINSMQDVFSFHLVTRDGFEFTVTSSFTVRTTPHQESECTQVSSSDLYLCCDTTTLSDNQLRISPERYTFGVTIINAAEVTPFAFRDNTEFVVEQFRTSLGLTLQNSPYALNSSMVIGGLLLMRFLIGKILHGVASCNFSRLNACLLVLAESDAIPMTMSR